MTIEAAQHWDRVYASKDRLPWDTSTLPREIRAALRPTTTLVWIETPANPTWDVTDIAAVAEIAHDAKALLAVDSTCATPVHTQPLSLGADIVMHSATKYLNGHSDVIAGALATREDTPLWQRIRTLRAQLGSVIGPFEAWLLMRGMRTLFARVDVACRNAQRIAEHFDGHDKVSEVLYPGLPSFAGHEVAKRQMRGGFGGMMSIRVRAGESAAIDTVTMPSRPSTRVRKSTLRRLSGQARSASSIGR